LTQGNLFTGKELKSSINVYHPSDKNFHISKDTERNIKPPSKMLKNLTPDQDKDNGDFDEEDAEGEDDLNKQHLKDLIVMAGMNNDMLTRYIRNIKLKEEKENQRDQDKKNAAEPNARKPTKRPSRAPKNVVAPLFAEGKEVSFEISDEDENNQKRVAVTVQPNPEALKRLRIARNIIKNRIQQKKKNNLLRTAEAFDDIKADEDFQKIGDVVIGQTDFVVNIKKNDEAIGSDIMPLSLPQQVEFFYKNNQIAAETEHIKDKPSNLAEKELNEALETQQLQNNPAFQALANMLTGKNSIFNQKKKKKNRDDDEDKKTEEQKEEEAIMKYYQKLKYNYLKLESRYNYDTIPPPAFNSILDILPIKLQKSKKLQLDDAIKEQSEFNFKMTYTMVELRKKKQKKKKGKKDKHEKKVSNKTSNKNDFGATSLGASSSMNDIENSDESNSQGSDVGSTISDDFLGDSTYLNKGSEAKRNRKLFFAENEKFIVRKPFPLSEQNRKTAILTDMKTDTGTKSKLNQVSTSTRKEKNRIAADGKEEDNDLGAFQEKFNKDFNHHDKTKKENDHDENYASFENLYMKVRAEDLELKQIERFNWSGNQIMTNASFSLTQTEKSIDSLNLQKLDIWMTGWYGLFYTSRRYFREFVDSGPINLLLMFSVFANTLTLAADGLTPASWESYLNTVNLSFTILFTVEAVFKLYGYGIKMYFSDFFNIFDLFVVIISMVEIVINSMEQSGGSSGGGNAASAFKAVRVFRIFRVLRVTRLLRSLRFIKVIINVVRTTVEQFTYIAILMFLFVFIFTLLGTQVFGGNFKFMKSYKVERFNFDSFSSAFYTFADLLDRMDIHR